MNGALRTKTIIVDRGLGRKEGFKDDIGSNFTRRLCIKKVKKKKGHSSLRNGGAVRRKKRSLRRRPGIYTSKATTDKHRKTSTTVSAILLHSESLPELSSGELESEDPFPLPSPLI